ncbi:hypothetical protein SAMN05216436_1187 [bacterium A37T11]|nr:hypothetical protein SAMN05216436_1187 [bacterium A37T11]
MTVKNIEKYIYMIHLYSEYYLTAFLYSFPVTEVGTLKHLYHNYYYIRQ